MQQRGILTTICASRNLCQRPGPGRSGPRDLPHPGHPDVAARLHRCHILCQLGIVCTGPGQQLWQVTVDQLHPGVYNQWKSRNFSRADKGGTGCVKSRVRLSVSVHTKLICKMYHCHTFCLEHHTGK